MSQYNPVLSTVWKAKNSKTLKEVIHLINKTLEKMSVLLFTIRFR